MVALPLEVAREDLAALAGDRGSIVAIRATGDGDPLPATALPMALAGAHHTLRTGGTLEVVGIEGDPELIRTIAAAAGFRVDELAPVEPPSTHRSSRVVVTAEDALPDHVGPGMRLLCCGLNPSEHAAAAGVGYISRSNRFWPAMAAAGLCTVDRDPRHLLAHHRIGMTDLVRRPTPRADVLSAAEYRAGAARLAALCDWLRPAAVAVVGLAGWRSGVDRTATVGWQPGTSGPSPVYVLPSTSGLNTRTSRDELVRHLIAAADEPPPS